MYNEEFKNKFLKERGPNGTMSALFKSVEEIEVQKNVDLCQMDISDIIKPIERYCGVRSVNIDNVLSGIKNYCLYCKSVGMTVNEDLIAGFEVDLSESMRRFMFQSPNELYTSMNSVFFLPEEETADSLYRAFLWCAYAGIPYSKRDAILRSRVENYDKNNNLLTINHQSYKLEEEARKDFLNIQSLSAFKYIHPLYTHTPYKQRFLSQYLFRGIENATKNNEGHITFNTVSASITKKMKKDESKVFRYKNIYMSGMFYRAYIAEKKGLKPDFTRYVLNETGVSVHPLKPGEGTSKKREEAQRYLRLAIRDYESWKKAFEL